MTALYNEAMIAPPPPSPDTPVCCAHCEWHGRLGDAVSVPDGVSGCPSCGLPVELTLTTAEMDALLEGTRRITGDAVLRVLREMHRP